MERNNESPHRCDSGKLHGQRGRDVSFGNLPVRTARISRPHGKYHGCTPKMAGGCLRPENSTSRTIHKHARKTSRNKASDPELRPTWRLNVDYYTMLLGATVGLSNVLMFPSVAASNGGLAFVFLYFVMAVCVGMPLVYLEVSWGQFCSRGPIQCYNISPLFKGVGLAIVVSVTIESVRYAVCIVYCGSYVSAAFIDLPFRFCNNTWNTKACIQMVPNKCQDHTRNSNGTCFMDGHYAGVWNISAFESSNQITGVTPSFEYIRYAIQGSYNVTEDTYCDIQVPLMVGLLCVWLLCFLFLRRGVKSLTKVIALMVLFAFLLFFYLAMGGLVSNTSRYHTNRFLEADWKKFKQPEVYFRAALQMMYSLGIAWGALPTLSSYWHFRGKIIRPIIVIVAVDSLTSVVCCIMIFNFIGELDNDVLRLRRDNSDSMLIFDSLAMALLEETHSKSLLTGSFFFTLSIFGLATEIAMINVSLTAVMDSWPTCRRHQQKLVAAVCLLAFLAGLPFTTKGGYYLGQFADGYRPSYSQFLLTFLSLFVVVIVYGVRKYMRDIEYMLECPPPNALKYIWAVLVPVILAMFLWPEKQTGMKRNENKSEDKKTSERLYGNALNHTIGWTFFLMPSLCLLAIMVLQIVPRPKQEPLIKRVKALLHPAPQWGPARRWHRQLWDEMVLFDESSSTNFQQSTASVLSTKLCTSVHPTSDEPTSNTDTTKLRSIIRSSGSRPNSLSKGKVVLSLGGELRIPGICAPDSTDSTMTLFSASVDSIRPEDDGSPGHSGYAVPKSDYHVAWFVNRDSDEESTSSEEESEAELVNAEGERAAKLTDVDTDERGSSSESTTKLADADTDKRQTSSEKVTKLAEADTDERQTSSEAEEATNLGHEDADERRTGPKAQKKREASPKQIQTEERQV